MLFLFLFRNEIDSFVSRAATTTPRLSSAHIEFRENVITMRDEARERGGAEAFNADASWHRFERRRLPEHTGLECIRIVSCEIERPYPFYSLRTNFMTARKPRELLTRPRSLSRVLFISRKGLLFLGISDVSEISDHILQYGGARSERI